MELTVSSELNFRLKEQRFKIDTNDYRTLTTHIMAEAIGFSGYLYVEDEELIDDIDDLVGMRILDHEVDIEEIEEVPYED